MAIPAEVQEVIRLAITQEAEEKSLQTLKDGKKELQDRLALINARIDEQTPIVQAARAALKAAAELL